MMNPRKIITLSALCISLVQAQHIDFGKIGSGKEGFKQYWGLDEQAVKRYENYMEIAGKYRHQHLNPLYVLAMISESAEDREYYAQKAAAYEHHIAKREIEAAWQISTAMEGQLANDMQKFTDELIGISTSSPQTSTPMQWSAGDELVLLLDQRCLTSNCLTQFLPKIEALPPIITAKTAILLDKTPPSAEALALLEQHHIQVKRFDAIEHQAFANQAANRIYLLRHGKLQGVSQ